MIFSKGRRRLWLVGGCGIAAGVFLVLAAEQADRLTSSQEFCITCHSMKTHVADSDYYRRSAHRSAPSGVVADCGDCHIPDALVPATWVHLKSGVHDIYATLVRDLETAEQWSARRPVLKERARQWFRDNDSSTCRHCHEQEAIMPGSQAGRTMHEAAKKSGATCIDCHVNLVHPPL